jgi:hypothetical protein
VFEDSYPGVFAAGQAGIDTIVIWDGNKKKQNFEGKVVDFSFDFTPYPGKMDIGYTEYFVGNIIEDIDNQLEEPNSL